MGPVLLDADAGEPRAARPHAPVASETRTTKGATEPGEVVFAAADPDDGEGLEGALVVSLGSLSPSCRGHLDALIDDAIEQGLSARRAGPPGIGYARDRDGNLSDQLFRARQTGASRLLLTLPRLAPLTDENRALSSDDTRALLFWTRATRERPVDLFLAPEDRDLPVHVRPTPLHEVLQLAIAATAPVTQPEPLPEPEPEPVPTVPEAPPRETDTGLVATAPEHDDWRTATLALTAARGPQPLATLERLFAASYLPLDTAIHDPSRTADPRAVHARDDFKDNFSHVYLEAFNAFALTGKRPKMVLDAPDVAARVARQTSARACQLLLVDGMRFDVGALVKEELRATLSGKAALTHEMILWSALPTTTTHQLATLARGVGALHGDAEEEREDAVVRGRTAQSIRRLKVGSRDVYRLDLCDVRAREAGDKVLPMLPLIARDVAAVIAKHALSLAPRTLLFVFGDHGFTVGRAGVPESGGASPEEVLVPAFAFLVGEAH